MYISDRNGGALGVAGGVETAAVALTGLVLVFLGALTASFESYVPQEKRSMRGRFQLRAWFSFVELSLRCHLGPFLAFLWIIAAAFIAIRDIT